MMEISPKELEIIRQWFDCLQDTNPGYLTPEDYQLAKRIYDLRGIRVPDSIVVKTS